MDELTTGAFQALQKIDCGDAIRIIDNDELPIGALSLVFTLEVSRTPVHSSARQINTC